jgi:hypothetical protein
MPISSQYAACGHMETTGRALRHRVFDRRDKRPPLLQSDELHLGRGPFFRTLEKPL